LVVADIVHFQSAGPAVAQQEIGFAGIALKLPTPENCQASPIVPMKAALVIALLAVS
jgi:hypothetical protein